MYVCVYIHVVGVTLHYKETIIWIGMLMLVVHTYTYVHTCTHIHTYVHTCTHEHTYVHICMEGTVT